MNVLCLPQPVWASFPVVFIKNIVEMIVTSPMAGVLLHVWLSQHNMTANGTTTQPFTGFTAERTWGEKEQNENTVKANKEKTAPYKTQRMLQDT